MSRYNWSRENIFNKNVSYKTKNNIYSFEFGEQRTEQLSTNGIENIITDFTISKGEQVRCNFYDTNGTNRGRPAIEPIYKKADGVLIVYDITNELSYEEIEDYFIPTIEEKCKESIPIIIVGNKTDKNDMRKISATQGEELALRHHYLYKETSSIDNSNISDIFRIIIEHSYFKIKEKINEDNNLIQLNRNISLNNIDNIIVGKKCLRCCC